MPKTRSKGGKPVRFHSAPSIRKSHSLEAASPWLHLEGISIGEMSEALKMLVGPSANGLSVGTVARLKPVWGKEYQQWNNRELDKDQWEYIWVDSIYSGLSVILSFAAAQSTHP